MSHDPQLSEPVKNEARSCYGRPPADYSKNSDFHSDFHSDFSPNFDSYYHIDPSDLENNHVPGSPFHGPEGVVNALVGMHPRNRNGYGGHGALGALGMIGGKDPRDSRYMRKEAVGTEEKVVVGNNERELLRGEGKEVVGSERDIPGSEQKEVAEA